MKKIVGLTLALMLAVGMISVATFAYFTDTETSSGNQLAVGTLDLKTNNADGVSQTLYATEMAPGATVSSSALTLKNAGTTDGAALGIGFSYAESDGSPNSVNMTADAVAAMMEVITLNYGGSDLLSGSSDVNSNLYKDVYDLKNSDLTGLTGIDASATKNFVIAIRLRSETGNDLQADGITMTLTFTLNQ